MTGSLDMQESYNPIDRDYLEFLIYKVNQMKMHGQNYFARKMNADKMLYDQAKRELNEFLRLLKKRGYTGERFNTKSYQSNLFE